MAGNMQDGEATIAEIDEDLVVQVPSDGRRCEPVVSLIERRVRKSRDESVRQLQILALQATMLARQAR
ncbi:hypothetical protein EV651_11217 [Kribbella sp. VKM Ac-2571]|nr:hypothetical protein EV651_11217 [Kribbella sp. VKM Ac-2571]